MVKFLALTLLAFPLSVHAGGTEIPVRKEFRQSHEYPYVFRPVPYLENGGPRALQYAAATPECARRNAPELTAKAKATETKPTTPETTKMEIAAVKTPSSPSPSVDTVTVSSIPKNPVPEPAPAFPVPRDAQTPQLPRDGADFGHAPDEVLSYFAQQPEEGGRKRIYLFDPIFEPAYSTKGPQSKATAVIKE